MKVPQENTFSVPCLTCVATPTMGTPTYTQQASPLLHLPTPDCCCPRNTLALGTQMQQIYKIFQRSLPPRSSYHTLKSQAR